MTDGRQTKQARLFRVTRPDDPVLQNGTRLRGGRTPEPVTSIAIWSCTPFGGDINPRDMVVFSGGAVPANADRSCASYSYEAGKAGSP